MSLDLGSPSASTLQHQVRCVDRSREPGRSGEHGLSREQRGSREQGVVTPVGALYLMLVLVVLIAITVAVFWLISSLNVAVAKRAAEAVANKAAVVGLDHLVNGTVANSPFPVLALPEPQRTQAVVDQIGLTALPQGAARRYLAPFAAGDIEVELSMVAARVTVTARAGRRGQFTHTASRSAAARAANTIDSGRVLEAPDGQRWTAGVLPLAVDAAAFSALGPRPAAVPGRFPSAGVSDGTARSIPLRFGGNAFAVAEASGQRRAGQAEVESVSVERKLLASAEFLSFAGVGVPGGEAPPEFAVGQRLVRAALGAPATASSVATTGDPDGASVVDSGNARRSHEISASLLKYLEGRPVIVPLVKDNVVQGFAVATLGISDSADLSLRLLPSALSPLARFDAEGAEVSASLDQQAGLAMGLAPSVVSAGTVGEGAVSESDFGEAECCDGTWTVGQTNLAPLGVVG